MRNKLRYYEPESQTVSGNVIITGFKQGAINCATTNKGPQPLVGRDTDFEKHISFQGITVCSKETLHCLFV